MACIGSCWCHYILIFIICPALNDTDLEQIRAGADLLNEEDDRDDRYAAPAHKTIQLTFSFAVRLLASWRDSTSTPSSPQQTLRGRSCNQGLDAGSSTITEDPSCVGKFMQV